MNGEFTFCPLCATRLEAAREGDRVRMKCPSCGFVRYRNPAPAAGIIVQRGNNVLLVKRRFDPYRGRWVIPSGFIEYDEDVRETALREVREETGLAVEIDDLYAVESCFDDPRGVALLILYRGHQTGGTLRAGDDAADVGFFPLDGLPEIAFEAHRKTLAGLLNAWGPGAGA
jgi:8-oxo-dGTP diphosphatase